MSTQTRGSIPLTVSPDEKHGVGPDHGTFAVAAAAALLSGPEENRTFEATLNTDIGMVTAKITLTTVAFESGCGTTYYFSGAYRVTSPVSTATTPCEGFYDSKNKKFWVRNA